MRIYASVRRWVRAHPFVADSVLAAVVFALSLGFNPGDQQPGFVVTGGFASVAFAALAAFALVFRRVSPLAVWAVTVVTGAVAVIVADGTTAAILPTFVALYTLASRRSLRIAILAAAATTAAYLLTSIGAAHWFDGMTYAVIGWSGMAAAIGAAVRSQRAVVAAAEDRAMRAEQTREDEAQRRVAEERLRIAHELHDVVAHHISVINVQSGVARHLLDVDPEQARVALTLIRESSQTVLAELSAILGLLRTSEDSTSYEPAPTLELAEGLVDAMRSSGMHVVSHVIGQPYPLPPLIDLTAYRIVQEGLTNAARHGDGDADVSIEYEPTGVRIVVSNGVSDARPDVAGSGYGVIGMRERLGSVGGTAEIGPTRDGRFVVNATLPRDLP